MIRKRAEKDTVNPPGQIVNPIPIPAKEYKPVHGGYPTHVGTLQQEIEQWARTELQKRLDKDG